LGARRAIQQTDGRTASALSSNLALATFATALFIAENRRPLRKPTQSKLQRALRNLAVAGLGGAVLGLLQAPVIEPLCRIVERRRWGLLKRRRLPALTELALGIGLMDYSLYVWHVLTHKVPVLWRMHLAHHVDLDLDASTAVRFHFAELAASIPYRAAQVLLIGIGPRTFQAWQAFTIGSVLFHHSNLRLPRRAEQGLALVVMTPRLHGIHHSTVQEQTNSNWSSGLTLWDHLHGTFRADVPQDSIEIGVPAHRDPNELSLWKVLALPFAPQRPSWPRPLSPLSHEARE
jgi:sterol desaturase/sphingolipid hydroxylase (fatty acid hydroxylase superfamily)